MTKPLPRECVEDVHVETAMELLDVLSPRNSLWSEDPRAWVYRGHANANWCLKAKAVREADEFAKYGVTISGHTPEWNLRSYRMRDLLERFRDGLDRSGIEIPARSPRIRNEGEIHSSAEPEREAWPLMALAQHHGLPTILLDWTRRAYVAAYFAAVEAAKRADPGTHLAVWALRRGEDEPETASDAVCFYQPPAATNPNLNAQAGLFTLVRTLDALDPSIEELLARLKADGKDHRLLLRRATLPASEAQKLLRLLSHEGVDGASMFPGADGVVRAMREVTLWDQRSGS